MNTKFRVTILRNNKTITIGVRDKSPSEVREKVTRKIRERDGYTPKIIKVEIIE